jgi:glutathione synthase/RimK-type ligase-like ATP-grasp enzyme
VIALLGPIGDEVTAFLALRLGGLDEPYVLIDPRQSADGDVGVHWLPGDPRSGVIRHGKRAIAWADIRSIYLRELAYGTERVELTAALTAMTETTDALVLNRVSASATNGSKPFQARRISEHGFRTPPTLITTDPDAARAFYDEHEGRVIHKSVSWLRSIVVRTSEADLERLELVRNCPTQFQVLVPGTDVRVHVVGQRVFATEIETVAVDYRYAALSDATRTMRDLELPDEIAQRCIDVSRGLGMELTGIDLRRDPDGGWWCFEVNPSPGFTFYQGQTGQPIGHAVVELLRTGRS